MIPKKIHYCWLSKNATPDKFLHCTESWRKYLPNYEFIEWNLGCFPLQKSIRVGQAFEQEKYAFATNYIRLYALVTEGGVYLDCDMELVKPFDDLLYLPYFACKENNPQGIEAAIMGAEKGMPWIMECLSYYDNRNFIGNNGAEQTAVFPSILTKVIDRFYTLQLIHEASEFVNSQEYVCVLPPDYSSPKNYITKKISITQNTCCIHHFARIWQSIWKRMLLWLWLPLSAKYPFLKPLLKK